MNKSTEKGELGSEGGPTWTESARTVSRVRSYPPVACRLLVCCSAAWRARHRPRYLKFSWQVRYRQSDVEKFVSDSVVDPTAHGLRVVRCRRRAS